MHEEDKHQMRVSDIVAKAAGDQRKQTSLTVTQANKITHPDKAQDRGTVAERLGHPDIAKIFFNRYKQLTQTRLDKLSIIFDLEEDFFHEQNEQTSQNQDS